jgi:hypothetical protein
MIRARLPATADYGWNQRVVVPMPNPKIEIKLLILLTGIFCRFIGYPQ